MRHKHFYVVAYDITDDRRRSKVVKIMESMGHRVNFSVFECMLTDIQYQNMTERLSKLVVQKDDKIIIYPLCTECFARIRNLPERGKNIAQKIVVV